MELHFHCIPQPAAAMPFAFGNRESRYGANSLYFTRDGQPFLPVAGELHFSRLPREAWERELLKLKDCGVNVVSTYVFWNYHEPRPNQFQFEGNKDIAAFLSLCQKAALPCILRIGPWCHGEVVYGGFPKFVERLARKRCDSPRYLSFVRRFWNRLAEEIRPYFDGETVLGVQLENEYGGSIEHIRTLRRIAEEAGFRTPFFTMTAWPTNTPDLSFLPMFGGYPEAPWAQNKRPLAPRNRFAISPAKTETEIGEDHQKVQKGKELHFSQFPYASCELGPGNQVTQHRRPIIGEQDGYGVGFARFASGMNWLGYYMFHGGRNHGGRMQESRRTGYPNNYPIIDYDFQAPLSRYGVCRAQGDRLRLMHLFLSSFDDRVAEKQAFFPTETRKGALDTSLPSCSVRMGEDGAGYFFVSTYERGLSFPAFPDVQAHLAAETGEFSLPAINIPSGSQFFYPFCLQVGEVLFDYVLAQPIAKVRLKGKTTCYFMELPGIAPRLSRNGVETNLPLDTAGFEEQGVQCIVLSKARAMQFHQYGNHVVFASGTVYEKDGRIFCETADGFLQVDGKRIPAQPTSLTDCVTLSRCSRVSLPHNHYLYSHARRSYFRLTLPRDILKGRFDVRLTFAFTGLNLQVFHGKELVNDSFNIDGTFVMHLREYREYLERDGEFLIRAVPMASHGIGHVYHETNMPAGVVRLTLTRAEELQVLEAVLKEDA